MKLLLLTVGKMRSSALSEICADYLKRLQCFGPSELKEVKASNRTNAREATEEECGRLSAALETSDRLIVFDERGAQLTSAMNIPVKRRVLLHRHVGFATHVDINSRIVDVLSRISGLELIEGPAHPGHMCSSLAAVPGALAAAARVTWSAAAENRCDTVCTIFHSCHRELAALDGKDNIRIRNWVHLVAESMGIDAGDAYRDWRAGEAPDIAAIERAEEKRYRQLVEPELRRPSPLDNLARRSSAPRRNSR